MGIRYTLGVDGLNLWLVALTALLFAASAVWLVLRPPTRPKLFAVHFGIAETAVLGAFLAQDLALFVLFFDLMLVPFYFLVGQWGGPERVQAAIKMVIYTLVGSLLMLAAAVATAVLASGGPEEISFSLAYLRANLLGEDTQKLLFGAFTLAFLIKMPAFPLHGWMPDAYRNMPLPALAVFSGVVSKVAAYGFLRIVLPLYPAAAEDFQLIVMILALCSILYGSLQAFTQTNIRLILGYSSIAQLGFITLGIFAFDNAAQGAQGALLQAINHGLVVAPLFLILTLLAARAGGSEDIRDMGGIAFRAPVLATLFMIVTLATARHARLGELRRRVPDPARRVPVQAGDRDHRLDRGRVRVGLRAAHVHPRDAQPPGPGRDVVRDVAARRPGHRPARAGHHRLRRVPAAGDRRR